LPKGSQAASVTFEEHSSANQGSRSKSVVRIRRKKEASFERAGPMFYGSQFDQQELVERILQLDRKFKDDIAELQSKDPLMDK
jgi:hypothetical protein